MNGDDARLFAINQAWGRGYLSALWHPTLNAPWAPGATGSEWHRGFNHACAEIGWLGATEVREAVA